MAALDFPSSPTVGDRYTANGVTYEWDGVSWNSTFVPDPEPYGFAFTKTPVASKILASFDTPIEWTMPAGLAGAQGSIIDNDSVAAAAPSAQTDFDIQSPPGSSIGTMRFAASSLTATFIFASDVTVPLGQLAAIVAPANLNGLTGSITGSIIGTR